MLQRLLALAPLHWGTFALWLAILFFLSGLPGDQAPSHLFPHQDKVLHFVFYFGGAVSLAAALSSTWTLHRTLCTILTVTILALIGAADEYRQQFTPLRSGMDPLDWLADIAGALAGALTLARLTLLPPPAK
jgi:VanZ family protein